MNDPRPFLQYLDEWLAGLPARPLSELIAEPSGVAIVSVDLVNGFCHEGALASPRVHSIIDPIVRLMRQAWEGGVRHFLLTQDTHEPDAVEFGSFPAHCVRGTREAEPVPELTGLAFFNQMHIFEKNSIDSALGTGLDSWVDSHPEVDRYIVVGDCTDLCIYQVAMHLRLEANARQRKRRLLLPANCVETYDLPVPVAQSIGAVPHYADLLQRVFLYSMMLNGIEVVASLG
jgi:nicotinamidase-related amidase